MTNAIQKYRKIAEDKIKTGDLFALLLFNLNPVEGP